MKNNFKVGDWGFCEYELYQIMEMDGERITLVSNGSIRMGGDSSDRFFPLDLGIKNISDTVSFFYKELRKYNFNLNYPDIHREYIARWVEMCENKDDKKEYKRLLDNFAKFHRGIIDKCENYKYDEVEGVKIFRR